MTAPSEGEEDMSSGGEDNEPDNGNGSDTTSAPSPSGLQIEEGKQ